MIFGLYIVDIWLQSNFCSFFCALLEIGGKMIEIKFIEDQEEKTKVTLYIMKALPEWFSLPEESAVYEPYNATRAFYNKERFYPLEVFTTFWDEGNAKCLFRLK